RRRHTRFSRDWSSDVCSSDLRRGPGRAEGTILTVTLNPSVDRTVEVASLKRGALIRATGGHVEAGGKGINVTRALSAHRISSCRSEERRVGQECRERGTAERA